MRAEDKIRKVISGEVGTISRRGIGIPVIDRGMISRHNEAAGIDARESFQAWRQDIRSPVFVDGDHKRPDDLCLDFLEGRNPIYGAISQPIPRAMLIRPPCHCESGQGERHNDSA